MPNEYPGGTEHLLPSHDVVLAEQARRSLARFVKDAWPVVEPGTLFVNGWHLQAITQHLQAVFQGSIRNLLITMPPRHCKSLSVSVFFPCWVWLTRPAWRFLFASYAQTLSIRDSVKCRRLIESPWYQTRWGHLYHLTSDQNQKIRFENNQTGYRIASSVEGSITGEGGDCLVCDDPHNVREGESEVVRQGVLDWWDQVMSTRLNDPKTGVRIIVQQRVHERDLAGHLLDQGGWVHLNLPAEYEGVTCQIAVTGWEDPRTEIGELLWPQRFGREEIEGLKRQLGSYAASAQLQQRPSPSEGGILKRHWWRYWHDPRHPLPPIHRKLPNGELISIPSVPLPYQFDREIQSWDCAYKKSDETDYVVGQHWGKLGPHAFLLNQVRERQDFHETLKSVKALRDQFREPGKILIESTANGPAIIATLRAEIPGIVPVHPKIGKEDRAVAQSASPWVETGNVFLPHPSIAPWVETFIDECAVFPNGAHDDQVDAWSQAMTDLFGKQDHSLPITPEFQRRVYLSSKPLDPVPGLEAFRFWMDGIFPTCILGQLTPTNQTIVLLDCVQMEQVSIDQLIDWKVVPLLKASYGGISQWRDVGPYPSEKPQESEHTLPQIVYEKLQGTVEPGEKAFSTRVNAIKTLLGQTGRLIVNCRTTPHEREHWIEKALAGDFAYAVTQQGTVMQHAARKCHPSSAVGEALGHGLVRLFTRQPIYRPRRNREAAMKRAKSYAVQ